MAVSSSSVRLLCPCLTHTHRYPLTLTRPPSFLSLSFQFFALVFIGVCWRADFTHSHKRNKMDQYVNNPNSVPAMQKFFQVCASLPLSCFNERSKRAPPFSNHFIRSRRALSLTHSHTHSLTHSLTLTHSHSHSHTHTHTHTPSPTLTPPPPSSLTRALRRPSPRIFCACACQATRQSTASPWPPPPPPSAPLLLASS